MNDPNLTDDLTTLADGLWTLRRPNSFMGLHLGMRVTIVRLPSEDLWVHSPIQLTEGLRANVDALGKVGHLVAPNNMHHMHVGPWQTAYPDAVLHAPEALKRKRKDLRIDRTLEQGAAPEWGVFLRRSSWKGCRSSTRRTSSTPRPRR